MHSKETIEKFRLLIEKNIEDLTGKKYDLNVDEDGDDVDQAQSALIMSMTLEQRERSNGKLDRLKEALGRIKDGSFGECEECGHDISVKRLEICLDAKHCIGCAEIIEKNQRNYKTGKRK